MLLRSNACTLSLGKRRIHAPLYGLPCVPLRHLRAPPLRAKGDPEGSNGNLVQTVTSAVDSVAGLVPESVPRPVARGGVAVVGGLIVFGLLKQVISGIVTLGIMAGVAYWWLTKEDKSDDDFGSSSKTKPKAKPPSDLDDPLSDARRIMDKYK